MWYKWVLAGNEADLAKCFHGMCVSEKTETPPITPISSKQDLCKITAMYPIDISITSTILQFSRQP